MINSHSANQMNSRFGTPKGSRLCLSVLSILCWQAWSCHVCRPHPRGQSWALQVLRARARYLFCWVDHSRHGIDLDPAAIAVTFWLWWFPEYDSSCDNLLTLTAATRFWSRGVLTIDEEAALLLVQFHDLGESFLKAQPRVFSLLEKF